MARGKQEAETRERTQLLVPIEEARSRLQIQLDRGLAAPNQSINENDEARRWYDFTSELLRQISSTDELRDEFTGRGSFSFGGDITTGHYLKKLRSIYERLELLPARKPDASTPHRTVGNRASRRVFVVHGRDDGIKESVARFIGKLELEPVVLHEQPNRGRTIIEKFEDHSDVSFAVVLFKRSDRSLLRAASEVPHRPPSATNASPSSKRFGHSPIAPPKWNSRSGFTTPSTKYAPVRMRRRVRIWRPMWYGMQVNQRTV